MNFEATQKSSQFISIYSIIVLFGLDAVGFFLNGFDGLLCWGTALRCCVVLLRWDRLTSWRQRRVGCVQCVVLRFYVQCFLLRSGKNWKIRLFAFQDHLTCRCTCMNMRNHIILHTLHYIFQVLQGVCDQAWKPKYWEAQILDAEFQWFVITARLVTTGALVWWSMRWFAESGHLPSGDAGLTCFVW